MNKFIIPIIVAIILAAGIGAYFVLQEPAVHGTKENIPYYFIAIHNEPYHDEFGGAEKIETSYLILRQMIEKADEYNVKLTLMFTPQWADYISESPERMAELKLWEKQGHEIAAHHHSIYHGNWDGYTNYSPEEAKAQRIKQGKKPETYLGTLTDYINKLKKINPDIDSGCVNDEHDKKVMPDEIVYDTCSGFANFGEPGQLFGDGNSPEKGKNEYVTVGTYNSIQRKWLAHYQITSNERQESAQIVFNSMDSGVYGAVTHSVQNQAVPYYKFLEFLHSQDPTGSKSKNVSNIIEQKLLPEKTISNALIDTKNLPISDGQGKCGDGICDTKEKADVNLCPKDCRAGNNHPNSTQTNYAVILHLDPVSPAPELPDGKEMPHYARLKQRVAYADNYNIKLSLWLGHGLAEYIERSPERMAELKKWIEQGHEIGIHHHSIYKTHSNSWDGYTSVSEEEAIATREIYTGSVEKYGYLGNLTEYADVFKRLENKLGIDIKSGIANEQSNKIVSMPDILIYSAGSGFANNGEQGRWTPDDSDITKAINEYISTATVNGIQRKWLTHYYIGSLENELIGEEQFDALDSDSKTIFVVVAHNFEQETEAYEKFLDFLHSRDLDGSKSMTITEVIEHGILPEKEIDLPCEEKGGTLCDWRIGSPYTCDREWLINDGSYRCCGGNCVR